MRRSALLALVLGGALLAARPAEARLIDLYAGATAGGLAGWGTTPNTPDFFDTTRGAGVGFDLGLKKASRYQEQAAVGPESVCPLM